MSFSAPSIAIGIQRAAAEEQRVMLVGEALGELVDHRIELQRLLDQRRQLDQARHEAALALGVRAVVLGERDHQHAERGELRGERLGRGDADLRARRASASRARTRAPASSPARCRWRAIDR